MGYIFSDGPAGAMEHRHQPAQVKKSIDFTEKDHQTSLFWFFFGNEKKNVTNL